MHNRKADDKMIDELFELIASLKTKEDCYSLFGDLCTVKEIEQMAQRIKAAKLLIDVQNSFWRLVIASHIRPFEEQKNRAAFPTIPLPAYILITSHLSVCKQNI